MKFDEFINPLLTRCAFFGLKLGEYDAFTKTLKPVVKSRKRKSLLKALCIFTAVISVAYYAKFTYFYGSKYAVDYSVVIIDGIQTAMYTFTNIALLFVPTAVLSKYFLKIRDHFLDVDCTLGLDNGSFYEWLYKRVMPIVFLMDSGVTAYTIFAYALLSYVLGFGFVLSLLLVFLSVITTSYYLLLFLILIINVHLHYKMINKHLPLFVTKDIYTMETRNLCAKDIQRFSVLQDKLTVRDILKAHNKLMDITDLINVCFGFALLIAFFGTIFFSCYYINLGRSMRGSDSFDFIFLIGVTSLISYMLLTKVLLAWYIRVTKHEAKKTGYLATKLLKSKNLMEQYTFDLQWLQEQAQYREVRFTMLDFGEFEVGTPYLLLSTIISYTMLLNTLDG